MLNYLNSSQDASDCVRWLTYVRSSCVIRNAFSIYSKHPIAYSFKVHDRYFAIAVPSYVSNIICEYYSQLVGRFNVQADVRAYKLNTTSLKDQKQRNVDAREATFSDHLMYNKDVTEFESYIEGGGCMGVGYSPNSRFKPRDLVETVVVGDMLVGAAGTELKVGADELGRRLAKCLSEVSLMDEALCLAPREINWVERWFRWHGGIKV